MKYTIKVTNGIGKIEGKDISKTISNIRNLLEKQNELQKEYYLKEPLIRFLYGKSIFKI